MTIRKLLTSHFTRLPNRTLVWVTGDHIPSRRRAIVVCPLALLPRITVKVKSLPIRQTSRP
jgi:hypothetical protein